MKLASNRPPCGRTRREFLWQLGGGFAALPLIDLLTRDGFFESRLQAAEPKRIGKARQPAQHFPAKAKNAVFFFMNGGPSQMDLLDPKTALTRHHGQSYFSEIAGEVENPTAAGSLMRSPFKFQRHGECGMWFSELLPHMATCASSSSQ